MAREHLWLADEGSATRMELLATAMRLPGPSADNGQGRISGLVFCCPNVALPPPGRALVFRTSTRTKLSVAHATPCMY